MRGTIVLVSVLGPVAALAQDTDGDGIPDAADVCPGVASSDQTDTNDDGFGDACAHPSAAIDPSVQHFGAYIGAKATVGAGTTIGLGTVIGRRSTVAAGAALGAGVTIARAAEIGGVAVGDGATVGYAASVLGDVGAGSRVGNLARVEATGSVGAGVRVGRAATVAGSVGDGTIVGPGVEIQAGATVGADVHLRRGAQVGAGAAVQDQATVGRESVVGANATVGARAQVRSAVTIEEGASVADDALVPRGTVVSSPCPGGFVEYTVPGAYGPTIPAGCATLRVDIVGGGGGGGAYVWRNARSGGGGGAGAYAVWSVIPGTVVNVQVGSGGAVGEKGGDSMVIASSVTESLWVLAYGGMPGETAQVAAGGAGGVLMGTYDEGSNGGAGAGCDCTFAGCDSSWVTHTNPAGSPGGPWAAGGGACSTGVNGGVAGAGGAGSGYGGDGGETYGPGQAYGGGGGGGDTNGTLGVPGASVGADGYVRLTWMP